VSSKCLPILLYGLEACPTNKADRNSMDFAINRFMMKLLKTGNIDIVEECMFCFNFQSVSMRIAPELLILQNDLQPVQILFAKCR
jgi:hypothetical protein